MRIEGNYRSTVPVSQVEYHTQENVKQISKLHGQKHKIDSRKILDEERTKKIREKLEKEIERLSRVSLAFDRRMNFLLHEQADRIFVQIIDMETEAIIREVPPEEILNLVGKMKDMVGIFLDRYI